MPLSPSLSTLRVLAVLLLMVMQTGCDRWPAIVKGDARRGLERCMAHKATRIRWVYVGRDTACGVVDAAEYRGLSGGPSPFVYRDTPVVHPRDMAGPDYEDYLLNRSPTPLDTQAFNLALLATDCRLPVDWASRCAASRRAGSDVPVYCPMMDLRNVMVLEVRRYGC
jgi:hypothetical protein